MLFGDILDQIQGTSSVSPGTRSSSSGSRHFRGDPAGFIPGWPRPDRQSLTSDDAQFLEGLSGSSSKTGFEGLDIDKLIEALGQAGSGPTSQEMRAMEAALLPQGTIPRMSGLPYKSSVLANIAAGTADITKGAIGAAKTAASFMGPMGGMGGIGF